MTYPVWKHGEYAGEIYPRGSSSKVQFQICLERNSAPIANLLIEWGVVTEVNAEPALKSHMRGMLDFFKEQGFYDAYQLSHAAEKYFGAEW